MRADGLGRLHRQSARALVSLTIAAALFWASAAGVAAQSAEASCGNGIAVPNPKANPALVQDCETLLEALPAILIEGTDISGPIPRTGQRRAADVRRGGGGTKQAGGDRGVSGGLGGRVGGERARQHFRRKACEPVIHGFPTPAGVRKT